MIITEKDYNAVCQDLEKAEDEADRLRVEVARLIEENTAQGIQLLDPDATCCADASREAKEKRLKYESRIYILELERDAARAALYDQQEITGQLGVEIARLAPLHVAARKWLAEERRQKIASDELNARLSRGEMVAFMTTSAGYPGFDPVRAALEKAIDEAEESL